MLQVAKILITETPLGGFMIGYALSGAIWATHRMIGDPWDDDE